MTAHPAPDPQQTLTELDAIDAAILRVTRDRSRTLSTIEAKLLDVSKLRTLYAHQGDHIDRLLLDRAKAQGGHPQ